MSIEVRVPNLPESVSDATLINWHKQPGDAISEGDNLVDLETDKVVLEVPAPQDGVLIKIEKADGETVVAGDILAFLDTQTGTKPVPAVPVPAQPETDESTGDDAEQDSQQDIPLSPAVRRLILENNLDPSVISGSGKQGRLTKADVLNFINEAPEAKPQSESKEQAPVPAAKTEISEDIISETGSRPEQRVPMTRLRAKIAERLLQAQQNAAMLTTFNEVNMQNIMDLRKQYKDRFEKKHEIKLGFMSFFVKASIEALKRFPIVNASIDNNDIIYHGYYDIGIAVSTPRGLIVPVLRDADQLDFAGIEKNITDFGQKARAGTISFEDLTGGTFTITNGGIFGSMLSTPLLNPPQSAILGMHSIKERPVIENGEVVVRPIMYLALSYDHRLIDGREAVQFLVTIKECLESPAHLLLNI